MIKDIIEILRNTFLRHRGVRTFRYQSDALNNAQNNFGTYQVYIDDVSYSEYNVTSNIVKTSFEIYILGQANVSEKKTILDVQNEAYTIAVNVMSYIDNNREWSNILNVYDWSIMSLSHYTSDDSCGVKLSLVLETPSPLNWCTLEDNFNDEPYEEPTDNDIDIPSKEVDDIDLTPIKLPKRC